jgi:PadR family transcriptional regulator PadR
LERDEALTSRRNTVNGRSRIYYSVTPAGSRRLADLSDAWTNLATAIQKMLAGGQRAEAVR